MKKSALVGRQGKAARVGAAMVADLKGVGMAGEVSAKLESSWLYHPDFPKHWTRSPLYSLAQWVNGLAFRDIHFSLSGMPVIKIAEIKGGISGQTKFTQQIFDESVRVRPGDLLFSWSGQPETSIDAFWWRGPEGWLNQHVFRVTPVDGIDPIFFYYLLRYLKPNFVGIARNKQTTGLGHVTKRDLENMQAAYPELPEQRAIAHILGTLDDKIELNRRMNETLEAMARALFKSWFIDFDPVIDNALAAGNPIPAQFQQRAQARKERLNDPNTPKLPDPIRNLFPNQFQDSPLGPIPTGWSVEEVGSVVDCVGGNTPSTKEPCYWDGGTFHWTTPKDLSGLRAPFLLQTDRKITEEGVRSISSGMLPVGTVLMSSRAPVGYLAIATMPVAINQGFIAIKPNNRASTEYMINWCQANLDGIKGRATGTTFAEISKSAFRPMLMLVPSRPAMDGFTKRAHPLYARIECALREGGELAAIRDALLPKLISGEVRIQEPLRFIGVEQ